MKKPSKKRKPDELRRQYDLELLGSGVRGKYYRRASETNLVLIEPELAKVFPNAESVNKALRLLVDTARAVAPARGRKSSTKTWRRAG